MRKAISIEDTTKTVARVLSIADSEMADINQDYFVIENYTEPPELNNLGLDKAYAVYDMINNIFKWVVVKYTITAPEGILEVEDIKNQNASLLATISGQGETLETHTEEISSQQETIDLQSEIIADILGGAY